MKTIRIVSFSARKWKGNLCNIIAIVIACIFFCYGCDPAPGIFLANRSENDKLIYITGGNYNLLKDGYDITYRPLRSSFFNDEKLYIGYTINDLLLL